MKRLFLAIGLAAFLMTSCCDGQGNKENKKDAKCEGNCKDKKEQCDHHHGPKCHEMTAEDRAEIEGIIDAFKGWDNLDEAEDSSCRDSEGTRREMHGEESRDGSEMRRQA